MRTERLETFCDDATRTSPSERANSETDGRHADKRFDRQTRQSTHQTEMNDAIETTTTTTTRAATATNAPEPESSANGLFVMTRDNLLSGECKPLGFSRSKRNAKKFLEFVAVAQVFGGAWNYSKHGDPFYMEGSDKEPITTYLRWMTNKEIEDMYSRDVHGGVPLEGIYVVDPKRRSLSLTIAGSEQGGCDDDDRQDECLNLPESDDDDGNGGNGGGGPDANAESDQNAQETHAKPASGLLVSLEEALENTPETPPPHFEESEPSETPENDEDNDDGVNNVADEEEDGGSTGKRKTCELCGHVANVDGAVMRYVVYRLEMTIHDYLGAETEADIGMAGEIASGPEGRPEIDAGDQDRSMQYLMNALGGSQTQRPLLLTGN